jgi:two-component system, chemotaxis family, chemotaxis protein CheY
MSNSPVRIIVADDAETVHRMFRKTVQHLRFPVDMAEARNGRDCLDLLTNGEFGLAFIDVFMPEMSGLEALGNARFMGNKIFVTLMSAYPNERCLKLARELQAYEFLFKPFGPSEIGAILETYRRACQPMRALIADDSPTQRRIVSRVLARSMFRIDVEETGDGKAALERCAACAFDLVFLDCNMPRLDGIETLKKLREREAEIKIVMISAERNKAKEREALALGAAAFLHKPFHPNEVDALLHRLFGLRSPRLMVLKARVLRRFDVAIAGRTVAVAHKDSGHRYEYLWFREPPHLRATHVLENRQAPHESAAFRAQAEKAALLELRSARLVG